MQRVASIAILTVTLLALTAVAIVRVASDDDPRLLGSSEAFDRSLETGCTNNIGPIPRWANVGPLVATTVVELPGTTAIATRGTTAYLGTVNGQIFRWSISAPSPELLVDLSIDTAAGSDQGLLNLAVTPNGDSLLALRTSLNGDLVLTFHAIDTSGNTVGQPVELYRLGQPDPRHNGGGLAFGPNGDLFLGVGDGGGQGDPEGAASDPSNPLGSIIRAIIDVESEMLVPSPRNPRVDELRDELVWATGLRNPFRIWFDNNDQLWVADIGERCREEVTAVQPTADTPDLGWSAYEGSVVFDPNRVGRRTPVPPTVEYTHENGACAVIGGTTYSGEITELDGTQIVADFCSATLMAILDGTLLELPIKVGQPVDVDIGPDGQLWVADLKVGVLSITRGPQG